MPAKKNVGKQQVKAVAADKSKKAAAKGGKPQRSKTVAVKKRKARYSVQFHRPYTLKTKREPKCPRFTRPVVPKNDAFSIIKHPLTTESAMKKIEDNNTLVFIVALKANKVQIKEAVKKLYDIKAVRVNTLITPKGKKKAMVRLHADSDALDVANKIGIL
eukprot:TRINITY_DN1247_c1_g1_i1.p2 TRINITY_DN1247_c1_g1~~TRINITY_DN1247_c1_g1_i1.p2  ORF type:complete len:186 (+),score=98.29 TRINITY_DN1247_c1_g1_i1:80-559(+)